MMIDIRLTLLYFPRWNNRSKDSLSNSSSWKALAPRLFTENWSPYSALQLTRWLRSKSSVSGPNWANFHAKTNSNLVFVLMFCGRLSPIALRIFLSRLQSLLRNTSASLGRSSKRSSNRSLHSRDLPEGGYSIRFQKFKKSIGQPWQLTYWASSIAKRAIISLGLWQGTSHDFSTYIVLTICS
jgi:hypothetical protein